MARHSRHSNDRSFYTYKERVDAGYAGFRKMTMGSDCFLPFGHCCLTLKVPKDPVVTPDGYLYEREAILESLLRQKIELQAEAKKYEEQERKKDAKAAAGVRAEEQKVLDDFCRADQGILSNGDSRHKRGLASTDGDARVEDRPELKKLKQGELLVIDKKTMGEKAFWASQNTQSAAPAPLKKVDTASRCPMSGKKLRAKDLLSVKFEATDAKMIQKGGDKGCYTCPISKKPISHQQAVVIKPSGWVVLESALETAGVLKDLLCPVTGKKLKGKEDILKLQIAGTGFSAHNDVEAKRFGHIRSYAGDARTQQGHLPKAGYAGLH